MQRLRISHLTEYRYADWVTFGPHRLRLRPREGHDVRIESSRLDIAPAYDIRWHRDIFDNSVALVTFLSFEWLGGWIAKLSPTSTALLMRIGGMLLATIGAQMVLGGLRNYFGG